MSGTDRLLGLHHVTAIAGPGRRCDHFYTDVLGLRRIKRTVNFDDPATHHLYYGDRRGTPGTLITFFPWERSEPGQHGTGRISAIAFAIPEGMSKVWSARLADADCDVAAVDDVVGVGVRFQDPDGMVIELREAPGPAVAEPWIGLPDEPEAATHPLPPEQVLMGLAGVRLAVSNPEATAEFLQERLGLLCRPLLQPGSMLRDMVFQAGPDPTGGWLAVMPSQDASRGRFGPGAVHHVALAVEDEDALSYWRERLVDSRIRVTDIRDRCYFKSIYFREPGGVIFELATRGPGFEIDEPLGLLGRQLQLPPWLESQRGKLESQLPVID